MNQPQEITHICQRTRMVEAIGMAFGVRYAGFVWVEHRYSSARSEVVFADTLPFGARLRHRTPDDPPETEAPRLGVIGGHLTVVK